jgi:hypothetical protein
MCKLHSSFFRGVGVADPPHVVAHMLKGLLDIVFKSFVMVIQGEQVEAQKRLQSWL